MKIKKTSKKDDKNKKSLFKIGRSEFEKIIAIEGMCISASMKSDFEDFDKKGLSAEKRRKALNIKYGKPQ